MKKCVLDDMKCPDCVCLRKNYVNGGKYKTCEFLIIDIVRKIIEKSEEKIKFFRAAAEEELKYVIEATQKAFDDEIARISARNLSKVVSCKCLECSMLDKTMLDSGYFYCMHWHNFTSPDAFCSFAEIHKQEVHNEN